MKKENQVVVSGGIGFFEALGLVFIVLKLCGVIDWSWWWVLAPIWMPIALVLGIIIIFAIIIGIMSLFD